MPLDRIQFATRATRDLRKLDGPDRRQVLDALGALANGAENLDVEPLVGQSAWLRLRVGDFRVLYSPAGEQWLVARVVNRRDLDRAVRSLG